MLGIVTEGVIDRMGKARAARGLGGEDGARIEMGKTHMAA